MRKIFGKIIAPIYLKFESILSKACISNRVVPLILHHIPESSYGELRKILLKLKRKYEFISPAQFQALMEGRETGKGKKLLLTFDDGFLSNKQVADKILTPLGIKGLFFVITNFVTKPACVVDREAIRKGLMLTDVDRSQDLEMMSWQDLADLTEKGHAIGSHTCNHQRLTAITLNEAEQQIVNSKMALKINLGVETPFFAYPFGDIHSVNASLLGIMQKHYQFIFTGVRGGNQYPSTNPVLMRESIALKDGVGFNLFVASGGLASMYKAERQLLSQFASEGYSVQD